MKCFSEVFQNTGPSGLFVTSALKFCVIFSQSALFLPEKKSWVRNCHTLQSGTKQCIDKNFRTLHRMIVHKNVTLEINGHVGLEHKMSD